MPQSWGVDMREGLREGRVLKWGGEGAGRDLERKAASLGQLC